MAIPKEKKAARVAGTRKFELPPREARVVDDNPVRELLLSLQLAPVADAPIALPQSEISPLRIVEPQNKPAPPNRKQPKKQKVQAKNDLATQQYSNVARGQEFDYFKRKYERLIGFSSLTAFPCHIWCSTLCGLKTTLALLNSLIVFI